MPVDNDNATDLWHRPAGISELLRVALPMMISTGCLTFTLMADRTLLLYSSPEEMGACMAAGNLFWVLVCMPIGIVSMTSAIVAQYLGQSLLQGREDTNQSLLQGREDGSQSSLKVHREDGTDPLHQIGKLVWQAIWLSLAITPFYLAMIPLSDWFFETSGQSAELLEYQSVYLKILLGGATGAILESALAGLYSGTDRTKTVMWVSIAAMILNVILDVVLIFGINGYLKLGIAGAGIASVVSFCFKALVYFVLMFRRHDRIRYGIASGMRLDIPLLRKLLFFGFPAGLQYVTESGAFAVIVLQVGQISTEALAATTMAINLNMLAFVPLIGVSIAASVLVGKHLVESGPELATRAAVSAAILAMGYAFFWAASYVLLPDTMLSIYQFSEQTESHSKAIAMARSLLRFVAFYCVIDALQIVVSGSLRGAGDTWFVLLASFVSASVWLVVGSVFEGIIENELVWWWSIMTCWILTLAGTLLFRYWQGRWRNMRMIEA